LKTTNPVQAAAQSLFIAAAERRTSDKKLSAISFALAGFLGLVGLTSLDAHALALGRLKALSSIGEPLRAEVEILDLTPTEARSLRASLVSPETYKAMGLDYNPDLNSVQFILQRFPNGRAVLQVNNSKLVTSSFVDIVLEVSWADGKITRDFTLLMTPPKVGDSVAPVAPLMTQMAPQPVAPSAPASAPITAEPPRNLKPIQQAQAPASPAPAARAAPAKRVNVLRGDTASELAMQGLPVNVSLDQMLLALLRSNPDAFVDSNVNRLKTGAVLAMPTADNAATVPRDLARQIVLTQSRDFNDFRQQLAKNAREAQIDAAGREATGKVQSMVQEKAPTAPAADKLTLSKGALKGAPAGAINTEEKLAQERQAKDAADRLAELSKNISDMNKLDVAPATRALGEPIPVSPAAPPALATGALPAVSAAALQADDEQTGLIDRLSSHPAVIPAGFGILGFILAWGFLRSRRNSSDKSGALRSAMTDSHSDKNAREETTVPPIKLQQQAGRHEPFGVDPLAPTQDQVARADEAEADGLLRSALKRVPQRLALHIELMDLYVSRNDTANFESLAVDALTITGGQGANWELICKKGQALDPTNPLYQSKSKN
jgi:pilus assembly protein FimV